MLEIERVNEIKIRALQLSHESTASYAAVKLAANNEISQVARSLKLEV